ncbi:hypothetical protein CDAR_62741 [Caerostris darwini]|uniref:Uncharacterized protein n=1 Tax=Caerostris darwini TaxID=1538125 RepID=A0AAV4UF79_9ARAC|nr:hypothetical protein CDAR_62741 [Caerostris darwini]
MVSSSKVTVRLDMMMIVRDRQRIVRLQFSKCPSVSPPDPLRARLKIRNPENNELGICACFISDAPSSVQGQLEGPLFCSLCGTKWQLPSERALCIDVQIMSVNLSIQRCMNFPLSGSGRQEI